MEEPNTWVTDQHSPAKQAACHRLSQMGQLPRYLFFGSGPDDLWHHKFLSSDPKLSVAHHFLGKGIL